MGSEEVYTMLDALLEPEGLDASRSDFFPSEKAAGMLEAPWSTLVQTSFHEDGLKESLKERSNSAIRAKANWSWSSSTQGLPDALPMFPSSNSFPRIDPRPAESFKNPLTSAPVAISKSGLLGARQGSRESVEEENPPSGKSFKELHAERNKQAQRRFRKRQKEKMLELQAQLSKLESEKLELNTRRSLLESACRLRDEELTKIATRQKLHNEVDDDNLSRAFQGGVTLTFKEVETITLEPSQIKSMSDRELARYWSNYVKEIAVLLVAVEGNPQPPTEIVERIQELVQKELLFLYIRAAITNMQSVKRFIAKAKIEEVRVTAGAVTAKNRWKEISKALALTEQQCEAVVCLWHGFYSKVTTILEERKQIHSSLQQTSHTACCGRESARKYLKAHELMEALRKSLRAEHVLIHEFIVTFFLSNLTPIQMARCFVRSFPFYPDIPAIAAWVGVAQNDSLALSKLAFLEAMSPASSS